MGDQILLHTSQLTLCNKKVSTNIYGGTKPQIL